MKSPKYALALFFAACGGGHGGPSTSPDASPDAFAGPPVTITSHDLHGDPLVGQIVLFHDAAGHLVARVVTDADGNASAPLAAGGSVTVLPVPGRTEQTEVPYTPVTYVDVAPGAHLHLGTPVSFTPVGTLDLTVPADGTDGATYKAEGPGFPRMGYAPPTFHVPLYSDHADASDIVLVASHNGTDRYLVAKDVAIAPGKALDLTASPWTDAVPLTTSFIGKPLQADVVQTHHGRAIWTSDLVVPSKGTATVASPGPAGDGVVIQIETQAIFLDAANPTGPVDLTGHEATATIGPFGADGTIAWTVSPANAPRIASELIVFNSKATHRWTVVLPGDRTSYRLPALPDDQQALWPADGVVDSGIARIVDTDDPGGYAAYVADPYAQDPYTWIASPPAKADGYRMITR